MSHFELKVRRMKTGETMIATLESFEDALTFLKERPEFMEVLGVISDSSASEQRRMRDAMRPYTEEELALKRELEAKAEEEYKKRMEQEQRYAELAQEKARREALAADPQRPMALRWDIDEGLSVSDPYDPREITPQARDAVMEWVAERNTWVESRGQVVGEANVMVYPGPVPDGEERVLPGGKFTPRLIPQGEA